MGDPRRVRKKYSGPGHPWQKARLEEEKSIKYDFGLVNKKEIYKATSLIKSFANQAKKLIASRTEQSEKESELLIKRLSRLGLLSVDAKLDDVLSLKIRDLLERRLQTLLVRKGLARSSKQARQFITHRHVIIADKVIDVPGYIVPVSEESTIRFSEASTLANEEHPERRPIEKKEVKKEKAEKKPGKKPVKKIQKKVEKKTPEKKEVKK
ncbi:30S ribosomal protein S4 [Candidatus Woesearchaeota archaeon]|nr:30S ribosomal protein S4 [Candidatus Woesearchaeota archaeon]